MKLRRKERRFLAIILALVMVVGMIPANQITAYAGEVVSKVWNFRGGQDGAFAETVEGTTGEFDGIIIDATSGKCSARTQGDTQINAGTVLNIPVSGKGTVTVKTYPGYHGYEINGMAADADEYTYTYEGSAGYVTLTATSQMYLYEVATLCEESDEVTTEPGGEAGEEVAKEDKIDVWDLGAEQLDETKYNNLLTEDIINGFYEGVAAGTKGAKLPSFTVYDEDGNEDFLFNDGGYSSTHRLRTTNANLTHYDDKSLTFGGVTYTGYIYSNKSATSDVYVGIRLQKNDILTLCVSSNSGASNICVESPSGKVDSQVYDRSDKGTVLNFYASEDGIYKVYSSNEKLLLARAYREHTKTVEVTGTVTAPSTLSNCEIAFENAKTGEVTTAKAVDGKYTVSLNEQYDYNVSLVNANGYVIASDKTLAIAKNAKNVTFDVAVNAVELVTVTGKVTGLDSDALAKLEVTLESDNIYIPSFVLDGDTYTAVLEKGVDNNTVSEVTFTNLNEDGYVYTFTSTDNISLRDGVYKVVITKDGYTQKLTSNLKVNGSAVTKTVKFEKITEPVVLEYKSEITVGTNGDYTTINDALDAIRAMDRTDDERVTVYIEPGNYEEMIVVDVDNVTLKNASENPSLEVINKGVDIADNAVRITSYYGHGYYYYSMGSDCKYDEEVLAVNKENGYYSYANPGSGTTNGSYWNATAVIKADGFSADGIIFENSYNQYISEKEANDIVVEGAGSKGDRNSLPAGSTAVQDKSYVERAAALAVTDNVKKASFDNCKFIGRQDTLYGGKNSTVAFNQCDILGATDYIFGGMTAVFFKCNLVLNTSDSANDVAYITAAQQASGRGYLMYNCNITSTTPGVDTASTKVSKAGYFGRPWSANTSEVVYYYTVIGEDSQGVSLVEEEGWNSSLGGTSPLSYEYGTYELTGVDNSSSRADWSKVLDTPVLSDGTAISIAAFLGNWQPFEGEDLSITLPDGTKIDANEPEIEEPKEDDNQFTKRDWNFAAFGTGVNTSTNTYSENADGTVTVASTNAKGKLVPASTDGLAFYYTAIDADKENFVLNAKVTVDSWTLSNGQEGFGLMAADAVGTNGDATPSYVVTSPTTSGSEDYDLTFRGNADGTLVITDAKGNEVKNEAVKANTNVVTAVKLAEGVNDYSITFTPDADYAPGAHQRLTSYDAVTFAHSVTYKTFSTDTNVVYVSPEGLATNNGTKESPLDIYTAVAYARAGQKIVLAGGTYNLNKTIVTNRGVDGTKGSLIYMIADPQATERPVFDFNSACAGMVLAGDYWYFYGFDVTKSADAQKGIQLSGSHCTLDRIDAYKNGNTGIQISRYMTYDKFEDWPSDDLILNCTSYLNADKGYEDADGFAAKLTVGNNVVFDGCISYYNADDGWDLFAKVETGSIGMVTVKNSVAYKNGYVLDAEGKDVDAGNGNGFKLGGLSISGHHRLINCVAFDNKCKGIDSNSCPDIQVENCTSFNNESFNVALYTNDAANTDFSASGIISYRSNTNVAENLKLRGTQDETKVYGTNNYYWDTQTRTSKNTEGVAVADDWFVSLDTSKVPTRNADGTINMNGLLELTDKAPADAGARMTGTSSVDTSKLVDTDKKMMITKVTS